MDIRQFLRVLRDRWLFIVACVVLASAVAAGYAFSAKPVYAASTQLFVSTSGDQTANPTAAYQGGLFSQQRVKSYANIVNSQPVVQRVKDQLQLPDDVQDLQQNISANAPLDTVLVDVSVRDRSAARAQQIANVLGQVFSQRVNELETPQGQQSSPVKVSVAQPPTLPKVPVAPNKKLDLGIGLLVGLALGLGIALLRETLNTRVNSEAIATELVQAPVLGGFRQDDRAKDRPLIVQDDAFSPRSEAFRQLRTNIRFLGVDHRLRSLVVTSSLAGEGKSTVASNLAIALAQSGEQVILVDADLRRPRLGDLLGLNPQIGLTNVLLETVHLDQALQSYRDDLQLRVLTSGSLPPNPSELLGSQRLREVMTALQSRSTILIFDTPPLLPVTDAAVLAAQTDGALLVCWAGRTHREQLRASSDALRRVGAHVFGVVLNRLPSRRKSSTYSYGYNTYYGPRASLPETPQEAADSASREDAATAESSGSRDAS